MVRRRVLESAMGVVVGTGIFELVGPSEDRVALIVSPVGGTLSLQPFGSDPNFAINVQTPVNPVVIHYDQYGSIVKSGWKVNTNAAQRSVSWIEVIERWVEGSTAGPEQDSKDQTADHRGAEPGHGLDELTQRRRRAYRRKGLYS